MNKHKLGVSLESFGLPLRRAIQEASRLGLDGVRINAAGDLAPENLTQSGRREFRNLLRANHLELSAVFCPLRSGLDVAENLEPRLEYVRQVMTLASELGPRITIVQAGGIPSDEKDSGRTYLKESLLALGYFGDKIGTILALETGQETGETLAQNKHKIDKG